MRTTYISLLHTSICIKVIRIFGVGHKQNCTWEEQWKPLLHKQLTGITLHKVGNPIQSQYCSHEAMLFLEKQKSIMLRLNLSLFIPTTTPQTGLDWLEMFHNISSQAWGINEKLTIISGLKIPWTKEIYDFSQQLHIYALELLPP